MKIKIVYFFVFSLLFSCQKEVSPYWGNAEMNFNGRKWETRQVVCEFMKGKCLNPEIIIVFEKYDQPTLTTEMIAIGKLPSAKGVHKISKIDYQNYPDCTYPHANASYRTYEIDATKESYEILEGEENYVEITDFDENSKEVKGRFYLVFIVRSKWSQSVLPDTLRFTEGRFHARVR